MEIVDLRNKRTTIISDGVILEREYHNILALLAQEHNREKVVDTYGMDFDVARYAWLESVFAYITTARTMFEDDKISRTHYKAAIKSLSRLEKSWKATSYFDIDLIEEYQIPYPDAIVLLATLVGDNTTKGRIPTQTTSSTPELPSGPPSGPNIETWLKDTCRSSSSDAEIPAAITAEVENETEITTRVPEVAAKETLTMNGWQGGLIRLKKAGLNRMDKTSFFQTIFEKIRL